MGLVKSCCGKELPDCEIRNKQLCISSCCGGDIVINPNDGSYIQKISDVVDGQERIKKEGNCCVFIIYY